MRDDLDLAGLRTLVTGGTKGIGEAVVARCGKAVPKCSRRRGHGRIRLAPDDLFVAADIATAEGCAAVVDAVTE